MSWPHFNGSFLFPGMGSRWYIFIQLAALIYQVYFANWSCWRIPTEPQRFYRFFPGNMAFACFSKIKWSSDYLCQTRGNRITPPKWKLPNPIVFHSTVWTLREIKVLLPTKTSENISNCKPTGKKFPTFSRRKWQIFESFWASPLVAWCKLNHLELEMAMSPLSSQHFHLQSVFLAAHLDLLLRFAWKVKKPNILPNGGFMVIFTVVIK